MPEAQAASASTTSALVLLHALVASAQDQCRFQYQKFIDRLAERLAWCAASAAEPVEAARYASAERQLTQWSDDFRKTLDDCLRKALQGAAQTACEQARSPLKGGAMDLSLHTFEAMQRKVLIDNLSQKLDATDPQALAALGLRINWLLQGEMFGAVQNPFRSEVFLQGVASAWQRFDTESLPQELVLRQLRVGVFFRLDAIWKALNDALLAHHVLPDAEEIHRQRMTEPAPAPVPGIRHRLQQWLAPIGMLHVIDANAASLLDKIVEYLASDDLLPHGMAQQLLPLQGPLREAARSDRSFFFDPRHPARRMSEAVLAAAFDCMPGDALHRALLQAVAAAKSGRRFDEIAADLEEALAQQEQAVLTQIEAKTAEALAQEKRVQQWQSAREEVLMRIEHGNLPTSLERFLQTRWVQVLRLADSMRDSRPQAWQHALDTMDALVRSVQPKEDARTRQEWLATLPSLVGALNTWLDAIHWEGEERRQFFDALARYHAEVVRTSGLPAVTEAVDPWVQARRENWLAQREARAERVRQFAALLPGCRFEFVRNDGSKVNCRLAWISPQRTRFVFAGRYGNLVFSLSDEALAQAMQLQRARVISEGSLIERALEAALDTLA